MQRFVAVVWAVGRFVTQERLVDTLCAVEAFELASRTSFRRNSDSTRTKAAARTVPFVRPVAAIVLLVTVVRLGHALGILAGKLRRAAGAVLAVALGSLIRAISAVIVVVTSPVAMDAATVAAGELLGSAAVAFRTVEGRRVFIGSIHAIRIAITNPLARDALRFA